MKSVTTFIELFQELNYNLSEKRLSSSSAVSVGKQEIFAINGSLNVLTAATPVSSTQIEALRKCVGDIYSSVCYEDECEERISHFLINLHLSEFMRYHFCDFVKSLWPILVKVNTNVCDSVLFHKLVYDSLSNCPVWNWISSTILVKIATNDTTGPLIKEALASRENFAKFERMKYLNRDFTTLMNLIKLLTTVGLEASFLPNLTQPYIRYIQTVNPNFKNLIQCVLESDVAELASRQCYVQPVDRHLLHIWVESKSETLCHHINLKCLDSFRTFPNLIIKLNVSCTMGPKTRSKKVPAESFITSLAAVLADGTHKKRLDMSLQMKDVLHFNWLVQYLSLLQKKRKVAAVSTVSQCQVSPSRNIELTNEKTRLQSFSNRRTKLANLSDNGDRKGKPTRKRKKISDEWDLTSDFESSFEQIETNGRKHEPRAVLVQNNGTSSTGVDCGGSVEKDAKARKTERRKSTTSGQSGLEDGDGKDTHEPGECLHFSTEDANCTKQSSKLFVADESSKLEQSDSSQEIIAPKERYDKLATSQAPLMLNVQAPVRTSTPINAEFTEFPTITDKTSDTEGTVNVMQEALKLFSSNLVNKLKRVEFEVLHKRNDLQAQVDQEYNKIEQMQRAKLKEIQEYCKNELNKIV
ncbi:hypothetical protein KGF57_003392 [Candida theae]|uniref:Uncharacterized protein n=1 Tax=Candida theae TaxID=1198502 RepID=A0AAD5BE50_9ASCO|nr:uncharacterized protein KGF57_003392 [Candida theae]KAI5957018.1 hypothetical protein KGF57_003392 [Candida theae]